jgi:lipid-A-disaccharide synthase
MTHQESLHIAIISGEHSGDLYALDLIQAIRDTTPHATFSGISGPLSHQNGLTPWPNCQPKSMMGFTQALWHLRDFKKLLQRIQKQLQSTQPDLLILVDYAGLNLPVAKMAYQLNIKVFYYIPPKVWAWGRKRLQKIQRYVTCVGALYPFESEYFARHHVQSLLITHPFIKSIPDTTHTIDQHSIALLPGSRFQEIKALLPTMLSACYQLIQNNSLYRFKLFCSEPDKLPLIQTLIEGWRSSLPIDIIHTQKSIQLKSCKLALVCSGTASFECAMLKVPMIVLYRTGWINYALIRLLVQIQWASLPNLILQQASIPELLQKDCHATNIFLHAQRLLSNPELYQKQVVALESIHEHMTSHPKQLSIKHALCKIFVEHLDTA